MVHANEILEGLVEACKAHDDIPESVTFSTVELDSTGQHSNVSFPIIEFSIEEIERVESRNSEKWGIETDDSGTEIGYIFTEWFDMRVTATVMTAVGTQYTHRDLGQTLEQTLYRYDKLGLDNNLPCPDEPGTLLDVNWITLQGLNPDHSFGMSPSVRQRKLQLDIAFTHEIRTTDLGIEYDTLQNINSPTDAVDGSDDGVIDLVVSP